MSSKEQIREVERKKENTEVSFIEVLKREVQSR